VDPDGNLKAASPKFSHESFKMMNSQQNINQIDSNKKEVFIIFYYDPSLNNY